MKVSKAFRALLLLLSGMSAALAAPASAQANDFVLLGGMNLTSIRTAQSTSINSFTGMALGVGIDFHINYNLYGETDLLFIQRKYAGAYTMPSFFLPMTAKYESKWLALGAGFYLGDVLTVSSDAGMPVTLDDLAMNSFDMGWILTAGLKAPLTPSVICFADFRLSRAFTNSDTSGGTFNWSQAQGLIGLRFSMEKPSRRRTFE